MIGDDRAVTSDPGRASAGAAPRLLIVEDEVRLATLLAELLQRSGYSVEVIHDGTTALGTILTGDFDLVLLDLMLPGIGGDEVLARARRAGILTPVIMLTARDNDAVEARALDHGADDYVTKPFSSTALVARIGALLRRTQPPRSLTLGTLTVDLAARRVWVSEDEVEMLRTPPGPTTKRRTRRLFCSRQTLTPSAS